MKGNVHDKVITVGGKVLSEPRRYTLDHTYPVVDMLRYVLATSRGLRIMRALSHFLIRVSSLI